MTVARSITEGLRLREVQLWCACLTASQTPPVLSLLQTLAASARRRVPTSPTHPCAWGAVKHVRRGSPCGSGRAGRSPGPSPRSPFQGPWRRSRGLQLLKCLLSLWCCQTCPNGSIQNHTLWAHPQVQSSNCSHGAHRSSLTTRPGDASRVYCTCDRPGQGASPQWKQGTPQPVADFPNSQCENRPTRPVGEQSRPLRKGPLPGSWWFHHHKGWRGQWENLALDPEQLSSLHYLLNSQTCSQGISQPCSNGSSIK